MLNKLIEKIIYPHYNGTSVWYKKNRYDVVVGKTTYYLERKQPTQKHPDEEPPEVVLCPTCGTAFGKAKSSEVKLHTGKKQKKKWEALE